MLSSVFATEVTVTPGVQCLPYKQEVRSSSLRPPTNTLSEINTVAAVSDRTGQPDTLPESGSGSLSEAFLRLGNPSPLLRPLTDERWLVAANSDSRIGRHCAQRRDRAIQNPGTHTQPTTAPVGLGAHGFLGEWPAGNSPLTCGGSRYVTGSELRAGCVSLHRCKWREGQGRRPASEMKQRFPGGGAR